MLNLIEAVGMSGCVRAGLGMLQAPFRPRYLGRPLAVCWFINFRCNLHCPFCCKAKELRTGVPELDLDDKKHLCRAFRESVSRLYLSGGEPTLSEDLGDTLEYCKRELRFKGLGFTTNGVRLLEQEKAFAFADSICISLHGMPDDHAEYVGMTPAMKADLLAALGRLARSDQTRHKIISFVITSRNLGQLPKVAALCREYGFTLSVAPANDFSESESLTGGNGKYAEAIKRLVTEHQDILLGTRAYHDRIVHRRPYRCFPLAVPNVYPDGRVCRPCDKGGPSEHNLLRGVSLDQAVRQIEQDLTLRPCSSNCFKAGVVERSLLLGKLLPVKQPSGQLTCQSHPA
ncbi:MAG: radical SAM protein [Pirellulales bacterium]|nr:radical SAM protein [Pirellulales bacterium]